MIFQHTWQAVLEARKTQTRRLVKPGEYALNFWGTPLGDDLRIGMLGDNVRIGSVYYADGRRKWLVYDNYAVQPGRGKKQVGRIRLTGIRQEHVQDITGPDAYAEGCTSISDFVSLWNDVHSTKDTQWRGNPLVWVLEFELVTACPPMTITPNCGRGS